jgi:hypothetical protein
MPQRNYTLAYGGQKKNPFIVTTAILDSGKCGALAWSGLTAGQGAGGQF